MMGNLLQNLASGLWIVFGVSPGAAGGGGI